MLIKRQKKRSVPGLNTTSTADISFILLVFFLVISSMDSNKGIAKQLPPEDKNKMEQTSEVDSRNVMEIGIATDGKLTVNGKPVARERLQEEVEMFVERAPERKSHVVSITMQPDSRYDDYFGVQDAISSAYSALRDKCARHLFHHPYASCNTAQQRRVGKIYPQRVMETVAGGRNGNGENE